MSSILVKQGTTDRRTAERWVRETEYPLTHGVEARLRNRRRDWPWEVLIPVGDIVEDLADMALQIGVALESAGGVDAVHQVDRERWLVRGTPSGKELVTLVAKAVDPFAERALDRLGQATAPIDLDKLAATVKAAADPPS
jgi:hypothetical protein